MAWYRVGSITVTNGSTTVTGSGTAWIANAGVGEALYAPDGRLYEIASISSDTTLVLGSAYLGSTQSGQAYVIVPSQSYIRDLAAQAADLVNNYSTVYNTVGQGKFPDGTLGTPGIRFNDDLDTGFYRSGTNEVTFVAGGVAQFKYNTSGISFTTAPTFTTPTIFNVNSASTALRITQTGAGNALVVEDSANPDSTPFVIDAEGRLTIGNTATTTNAPLEVVVSSAFTSYQKQYSNDATPVVMTLGKTRGTTPTSNTLVSVNDGLGRIEFQGADGTSTRAAARIDAAVDGTPGTNDMPGRLVFSTTADGASSPTERMRIDSAGNLGLGDVAATFVKFNIRGTLPSSSTASRALEITATVPSTSTAQGFGFYTTLSTQAASFTLATLEHFRSGQGTIGLGSTVTNQRGFHADSSLVGATNNYGFYSDIASGTGRWNFYANGTAANYFAGNTQIANYLDVTTVLAAGFGLRVRGESGGTYAGIQFTNNAANAQWAKIVSPSANVLTFQDGGNNSRMYFDSVGRVGINTTDPKLTLTVAGNGITQYTAGGAADKKYSDIVDDTSGVFAMRFVNDAYTAANSFIQVVRGTGYDVDYVRFLTASNQERMRVTSAGNVGINTSAPAGKLHVQLDGTFSWGGNWAGGTAVFGGNAAAAGGFGISYNDTDGAVLGAIVPGVAWKNIKFNSSQLIFATAGATEAMRIDSSGNVGIGTATPSSKLDVNGDMALPAVSTENRFIKIGRYRSGNGYSYLDLIGDATYTEFGFRILRDNTGANAQSFIQHRGTGALSIGSVDAAPVTLSTNSLERMRIDSSGNVLFGKTAEGFATVGAQYSVDNKLGATASNGASFFARRNTSNGDVFLFFRDATNVGTISVTTTATSYNTSSDARLKENIFDAPEASSLIDAIQVRSFDWKADGSHQRYGMVAQELEPIAPEAVTKGQAEDDMWAVDYSKLVPMLLKEIQSLRKRVAQLEGA